MRENIFVFLFLQENSSLRLKLMYDITYYYLNSLSITDCNVIKKYSEGKHFSTPRPKKKKYPRSATG
jgi:hypothetical protein